MVGGILKVEITGETGTIGGTNIFSLTPAALNSWPSDVFELYATTITLFEPGSPPIPPDTGLGVLHDVLDLTDFLTSTVRTANTGYTAVFEFRITKSRDTSTPISPIAYINSGTPIKHTGIDETYLNLPPIMPTSNYTVLEKSVAPTSLPDGGDADYTLTLTNSGVFDSVVDTIVDSLPEIGTGTYPTYAAGSSYFNGVQIGDPAIVNGQLIWSGNFTILSVDPNVPGDPPKTATLVYQTAYPETTPLGTYTNSAIGFIGPGKIDTTLDTTDNMPATATINVGCLCGDGILTDPEECDDDNTTSGDGCSAACDIEPDTQVDTGPATPSNATNPGFTFSDPTAPPYNATGYDCSEDGGSTWVACNGGTYTWTTVTLVDDTE